MTDPQNRKYKILLTNDDGIDGPGLNILAGKLSEVADVFIIAPSSNRSAVSSHFTISGGLELVELPLENSSFNKHNRFSCSGFPVDCVITGVKSDLFKDENGNRIKFDAVFSGINKGPNMGTDCIYSGTVAAARQGVLFRLPGIAFSLRADGSNYDYASDCNYDYEALANFARDNIELLIKLYSPDVIVNVNGISCKKYKGVKPARLCLRDYKDSVTITGPGYTENKEYSPGAVFKAEIISGNLSTDGPEDNEYKIVKDGYISISRLHAEPVDYVDKIEAIDDIEDIEAENKEQLRNGGDCISASVKAVFSEFKI